MNKYWATGCNTKVCEKFDNNFVMEYNSSIKMWRINHPQKVPKHLMGYSPHQEVLRSQVKKFVSKNKT